MKCQCKGDPAYPAVKHPERCKLFKCSGCRLWQPWCFGASDATPKLCDECAVKEAP